MRGGKDGGDESLGRPDKPAGRPPDGAPGRREFLRGLAAAGAVAGAGGLLAGCQQSAGHPAAASPSRTVPRRGGNLRVGLAGGSSQDTVDPHRGLTYLDTGRFEAFYQPLVKLGRQAAVEYVLAESISPHKGSLSEWIIRLRPGVTFHDGKDFSSEDVIFTVKRIISGNFAGTDFLGPIDVSGVRALDKRTVLVPMKKPFGSRAASARNPRSAPAHLPTRASPRASAASSSGTRTTGSPACPT